MHNPVLADLVAQTGELATLPETVVELLNLLQDSSVAADKVQTILERDPAMTGNILKLANSAFYGNQREITTVRQALVMLGNRSVATLAFATSMAPVLRRDLTGYGVGRDQFWQHALVTGAAASLATGPLGIEDLRSEAFTAGLVHDVGMLVIDPYLVDHQINLRSEGPTLGIRGVEKAALGFDHCQAGALLARKWDFPEILVQPICYHHSVDQVQQSDGVVKAVAAGDIVAEALIHGPTASTSAEADASGRGDDVLLGNELAALGMPRDWLEQVRLDLTADLQQTLAQAAMPVPVRR